MSKGREFRYVVVYSMYEIGEEFGTLCPVVRVFKEFKDALAHKELLKLADSSAVVNIIRAEQE